MSNRDAKLFKNSEPFLFRRNCPNALKIATARFVNFGCFSGTSDPGKLAITHSVWFDAFTERFPALLEGGVLI